MKDQQIVESTRNEFYRTPWNRRKGMFSANVFFDGHNISFVPKGQPGPEGSKKTGEGWEFIPPEMPGTLPGMPLWGRDAMEWLENSHKWEHKVPHIEEDEALLWIEECDEDLRDSALDGYPYAETRIVSHDTRGHFWHTNKMAEDWVLIVKYPTMPTWKGEDWHGKYGGYPGWDTRSGRKK